MGARQANFSFFCGLLTECKEQSALSVSTWDVRKSCKLRREVDLVRATFLYTAHIQAPCLKDYIGSRSE
jgi:hypothetical protein